MPKPADAKVWNEDLVEALRARQEQCQQNGSPRQHLWRDGAAAIEAVRQDIYAFRTGRIVGLPSNLKKSVEETCRKIIQGSEPIYPPGFVPTAAAGGGAAGGANRNPYLNDPYLKRIKSGGGAVAILMAFRVSQRDTLTKGEICRIGQQFCDEQMDSNWHQGRAYGAWSSNTTLQKHDLLTCHKTARWNERANGIRSQGPSTYHLTQNGKRFIEALLESRPNLKREVERAAPSSASGGELFAAGASAGIPVSSSPGFPIGFTSAAGRGGSPPARGWAARNLGAAAAATNTTSSSARKSKPATSHKDEEELREWALTAEIGQQKTFKVGKARRHHLHGVCDDLNTILKVCDKQLMHESDGVDARSRVLYVTVIACHGGAAAAAVSSSGLVAARRLSDFSSAVPTVTPSLPKDSPPRRRKAPPPASGGAGYRANLDGTIDDSDDDDLFGSGSPMKRARVPASAAAAHAALARQALFESKVEASKPKKKLFSSSSSGGGDSRSQHNKVAVIDLLSSDDDEDEDRKKPAVKATATTNCKTTTSKLKQKERTLLELLDSDSEEDELLKQPAFFAKKKLVAEAATNPALEKDAVSSSAKDSCQPVAEMTILIDSRERDRNATPRTLRMELTRMLEPEQGSKFWPNGELSRPIVREATLPVGDFAFEVSDKPGVGHLRRRLPVYIERKRVSDLVQRSVKKDHWKQLQEIRGLDATCLFLIEGDFRTAQQFTAYGSQHMDDERRRKMHHVIDDEESLLRFIGRAILSFGDSVRFIQTKDEHGSLRAAAAVAAVLAATTTPKKASANNSQRSKAGGLAQQLKAGGIPWEIANCVEDAVGTVDKLQLLYSEALADDELCDNLLVPIIEDVCPRMIDGSPSTSTPRTWSAAVRNVFFSSLRDPTSGKVHFEEYKLLVEDHARLLCHLHSGKAPDRAIDSVFDEASKTMSQVASTQPRRVVHLRVPESLAGLFPKEAPGGDCFYKVHRLDSSPTDASTYPVIEMQTKRGSHVSGRLLVHVVEGAEVLKSLAVAAQRSKQGAGVALARSVASEISKKCRSVTSRNKHDARIVIVRGLQASIDAAARRAGSGYNHQTRSVIDMAFSALMLLHNFVVLQAVRKTGDCEIMVQQLSLACFHYHMLVQKD